MSKISELSDGGSIQASDYLIAVRSGGNVKVRMDQINVDQIDLGDNEFIRLGNSQDLTLVHNASNSIINQAGIGDLLIQKAGSTKLTVNSTGIDVTGTATMDGLTVDTTTPFMSFKESGATKLFIGESSAVGGGAGYYDFYAVTGLGQRFFTNSLERMRLDSSGRQLIGYTSSVGTAYQTNLQVKGSSASNYGGLGVISTNNEMLGVVGTWSNGENSLMIAADPDNLRPSSSIVFTTDATEAMRIDANGNVGIAESNPVAKIHIQGSGTSGQVTSSLILENSSSGTAGLQITGAAGSSHLDFMYGGGPSTGTNTLTTGMSMTLEGSGAGNVGIGTSSPSADLQINDGNTTRGVAGTFHMYGSAVNGDAGDVSNEIFFRDESVSGWGGAFIRTVRSADDQNGKDALTFGTSPFGGSVVERMRIDANGVMSLTSVGTVAASAINNRNVSGDGGYYTQLGSNCSNTSSWFMTGAITGVGNKFYIYGNGNIANTNNSYGAISDVKLKENIVDASSQWNDIKALTVRKYSLKADNLDAPNMLGVIAQEVEAAGMGGLVYESPDMDSEHNDLGTVTKQVNYSIIYMKAVKALQEAMDRIETLEAKVAALES